MNGDVNDLSINDALSNIPLIALLVRKHTMLGKYLLKMLVQKCFFLVGFVLFAENKKDKGNQEMVKCMPGLLLSFSMPIVLLFNAFHVVLAPDLYRKCRLCCQHTICETSFFI